MIFIDKILLKKVKDAGFCLYCNFMPTYLQVQHLLKRGEEDLTTNVMVSVIFYYTQEFEAITPDIKGHLEHLIENTNSILVSLLVPWAACFRWDGKREIDSKSKVLLFEITFYKGSSCSQGPHLKRRGHML